MNKLFPYQKRLIDLGISLAEYKAMQERLLYYGIDLNHVHNKGFRLFILNADASYTLCWLNDDIKDLFTNLDYYLAIMQSDLQKLQSDNL